MGTGYKPRLGYEWESDTNPGQGKGRVWGCDNMATSSVSVTQYDIEEEVEGEVAQHVVWDVHCDG